MGNMKDFATGIVATAPSPANSGTSLTLQTGQGVRMPAVPFYATVHPSSSAPTLDNAEKIQVTNVTGDTLTIVRAQGDTTAKSIAIGWVLSNTLFTADLVSDAEKATWQNRFNGCISVPSITDHGDGSITVGSCHANLSANVDGSGNYTQYELTGGTFTLTNLVMNYIVANYNGGSPVVQVITDVDLINETTITPIYSVFRNGTYLHTQNWDKLGLALANKLHQSIVKTQRYRRQSGMSLTESGTRNLNLTAGIVWTGAIRYDISAVASSTDNMFFWYHSGGNWTSSVVSQYNNTQYDNGTNLTSLGVNRYTVNWVFRGIEDQKHLYIVLGTGNYTLNEAQAAQVPALPTAISSHAMLVGKVIVQNGVNTATSIQSAFDTAFSQSSVSSHTDLINRDVADQHPASAITNTPAGNIAATTVQAALNELDTEKENVANKSTTTTLGTSDTLYPTQNAVKTYVDAATTMTQVRGETPSGTINGSNVTFTLASTPATNSQRLYKNGIRLKSGSGNDYTISGATITMTTAPATGTVLLADYEVSSGTFANGVSNFITNEVPSGTVNGSNTAFTTAQSFIAGTLQVWVNGIKQLRTTHYTETTPGSGTFSMSDAPLTGDVIEVSYQHTLASVGDADMLDSYHASTTSSANKIPVMDSNGLLPYQMLGGAWTSYTPTATAATGTFTSVSATGKYTRIGNTIIAKIDVTVTTVGTGVGLFVTLPVTAAFSSGALGSGREDALTGNMCYAKANSTTQASVNTYNNGNVVSGGNGSIIRLLLTYEAA